MSVDTEFSNGPSTLTEKKLPEVGNSACASENASSSDAVVLTKETLNCPDDKGQMENTASEITGGADKRNYDEKLSKEGEEAAKADGNSEGKLQCDQSENTEIADGDGQDALILVTKIKGVNEIGGDSDGDIKLSIEESADAEKIEGNGQRPPDVVTEIKAFEEFRGESNGSRKSDKIVDAEQADINSSRHNNPDTVTIGMEEMRSESSSPYRNNDYRRFSEESVGDKKADSRCQKMPHLSMEMTRMEQMGCLSNLGQNSCEDKSLGNQSDNAKNEDKGQDAFNMVMEIKGINERGGDSNGDVKLVCEESADTKKLESNSQGTPGIAAENTPIIRPGSVSSSEIDENVDAEKGGSNDSMAANIVTEINGLEGESDGAEKINIVTEITGIEGESNGAEEISDDKPVYQESTNTEKAESQGQRVSHMVSEIKGTEVTEGGSDGTDNSTCEERKCVPNIVTEISGLEGESICAENIDTVTEISGIEVESNGGEEIIDDKLVHQESTKTQKAESQGQRDMVSEIKGIEETEGESDGTDKRTDGNSTGEERNCFPKIVTEIDGLEGESTGAEKVRIVTEIIEVASSGADEISADKPVYQERTATEKEESQGQRVSHMVGEIEGLEEAGGESDGTDKRTDGNSTCEERKDAEVANGSSLVNKGEILCSIDAVAFGKESPNSSIDDVQSVGNRVFESIHNDERGRESDGDKDIDDKAMSRRDVVSESLHTCGLGSEGLSGDSEFSHGLSILPDARLHGVENSLTSISRDMSSNDATASGNESCTSHGQSPPDMVQEIIGKAVGSESNGVDSSSDDELMYEEIEDGKRFNCSSTAAEGVPSDAEFSIDQSVLADVKLCEAENTSASSSKEVCRDVICGNTLNDPIHDSKMVPIMAIEFTGIKKEGDSNVADQTSDDKLLRESEDAEKSPNINIGERMSCYAEICHDEASLADLELPEAGNTSASSSRDVFSNDAVAFDNEILTCTIKINPEPPNMSKEIAGTGEMGGGSDRSDDDKLICEESGDAEISNSKEVLTTLAEFSPVDAVAARDVNGSAVRGFYFLIRMPRFDDEKLRERIRVAELNVDEKTQYRDAFRQKIRNKRANCRTHGAEFEAAKTQERDARKQVRTKRSDISTLQDVIDKAKNAVAIEEIDTRICNMEHIIGHETVPLKEEKLLIREIKQLKQLRGQLSSNIGSQNEVQKALDERDVNEERLRTLKKELDDLKLKVSQAETIAKAASRKYEDESRKLKELQTQFKAADDSRQEAYEELRNLKRGFYEKNIHFRTYKEEATLASDYARKREMEALNHLCMNQVERYMELWNKNDEFRKEYIRCNTRSTLRRFGTFDGRTLAPDEEPNVLPSYAVERVNRLVTNVDKVNFVTQTPISQQVKQVVVFKDEIREDKVLPQAAEGVIQIEKTKETQQPIQRVGSAVDEPKEVEHMQAVQELEAARKEEELRKLEAEARLKEQRRLEEIAKAKEALERKKRNAEKAQQRAELRAQKEEEQRLKEREKRLRKKERKKGAVGENESNDGETALISTSPKETIKEPEATENPRPTLKKPQKASQYTKQNKTKSIPPPLRNRNRRKLQQWLWLGLSCVLVVALFFLGNIGFFSNLKPRRSPGF